jgi:serine/threonine-protein kinase
MGTIYEAVHLRLGGKRYAIKLLASRYASNPDALARFRREALVTSGLRNEHIVEVHDFNVDGDLAYLVMELLVGEDLAARLERAKSLSIDAVTRILAQVVTALDAAHRARIIHRDLKPQNIFLCTRDGRDDYVKILDFGISKLLDSSTVLTGEHALLGTPYYMAPEQALGKSQDIDGRADVFALGAILWELLTGRVAFGAPTLESALYKVCQVDPPDVHMVRPDLPPAISMVLRRALAKDPAGRTPDVVTLGREFAAALQRVAPDSVPPPAPGGMTSLAEVMGWASPNTVASLPAAPAPRVGLPMSREAGAGARPASGSPNHDTGPSPAAANHVYSAHVASAAPPASMPSWSVADELAHPDPGAAYPMATGSIHAPGHAPGHAPAHAPARRSRRRAILALAAVCATAGGVVTGAVLGGRAGSSSSARVGEMTAAAPPSRPPPAPASQRSDEVEVVFEVEPAGAQVALRVDGVLITDRRVHRTRSRTPLVVTAEAAGFLPFRADPVPDQDQTVMVNLRPSPAVAATVAPSRRAPAPASTTRTETHPPPSRATPPETHPPPSRATPPETHPPPSRATPPETHPPPSRATPPAGAGSSVPTPGTASPTPEPPAPTASPASRPRYVPSPSVTRRVPPDAGVAPQQPGAPAAPAPTPAKPPQKTGTIFDNP